MSDSISLNTGIFLFYLFIMIALYFLLSAPVDAIFDGLTGIPLGEATDEMATYVPYYRIGVKMAFSIGIATPVMWFLMKIFSVEPIFERFRRY